MPVTFAGTECADPVSLRDQLVAKGLPVDWYGLPNSYECPAGTASGEGWVLLSRGQLDDLDLNTLYPLAVTSMEGSGQIKAQVTAKALLVREARCVAPGLRGDANSAYLCRLADRRWLYRHIPINKAYNVVQPGTGTSSGSYYSATENSGSPWTWQGMVNDIWSTAFPAPFNTAPTLPAAAVPSATPENFSFYGSYALDALGQVLDEIGCVLTYDPVADSFGIAQVGATDSTASTALAAADNQRVWDDEPLESNLGNVPASVTVAFPKDLTTADTTGASPYYTVNQTDPTAGGPLSGTQAGSSVWLFDPLTARYNSSGTLLNASALSTQAQARAADYFRILRQERLRRIYGRPLSAAGLRPGKQIASLRYGDRGRGSVTEIRAPRAPALGTALTMTPPATSSGPTYQAVSLSSNFNLTGSGLSGSWQSTGLSLTLQPGTYLIIAQVTGELHYNGVTGVTVPEAASLHAQLQFPNVPGVTLLEAGGINTVSDAVTLLWAKLNDQFSYSTSSAFTVYGTATISNIAVVTNANPLTLYAMAENATGTGYFAEITSGSSTPPGGTNLIALKFA